MLTEAQDEIRDPADVARDKLLISLSRTILALSTRVASLEGQATLQADEIENFRAIASEFARFLGEARS